MPPGSAPVLQYRRESWGAPGQRAPPADTWKTSAFHNLQRLEHAILTPGWPSLTRGHYNLTRLSGICTGDCAPGPSVTSSLKELFSAPTKPAGAAASGTATRACSTPTTHSPLLIRLQQVELSSAVPGTFTFPEAQEEDLCQTGQRVMREGISRTLGCRLGTMCESPRFASNFPAPWAASENLPCGDTLAR